MCDWFGLHCEPAGLEAVNMGLHGTKIWLFPSRKDQNKFANILKQNVHKINNPSNKVCVLYTFVQLEHNIYYFYIE